jgi:hypothetical protein
MEPRIYKFPGLWWKATIPCLLSLLAVGLILRGIEKGDMVPPALWSLPTFFLLGVPLVLLMNSDISISDVGLERRINGLTLCSVSWPQIKMVERSLSNAIDEQDKCVVYLAFFVDDVRVLGLRRMAIRLAMENAAQFEGSFILNLEKNNIPIKRNGDNQSSNQLT